MSDELFVIYYKPDESNDKLYFAYRDENGKFIFSKNRHEAELFDMYEVETINDEISDKLGIETDIEGYEDDE